MRVYLVTNTVNGKRYVGITKRSVKTRWSIHLRDARQGRGWNLHAAIRKYGPEAFTVAELESASSPAELAAAEVRWIAELGTHVERGGYNLTYGGEGATGRPLSDETRKRLGGMRGRKHSPESIAKMIANRAPHTHSQEARAKISKGNRGKTIGPEHRAAISKARKGIVFSPETRAKIGETSAARTHSAETRAKISRIVTGRPVGAETRQKLSAALKGHAVSEETRAKIAAANRAFQARKRAAATA